MQTARWTQVDLPCRCWKRHRARAVVINSHKVIGSIEHHIHIIKLHTLSTRYRKHLCSFTAGGVFCYEASVACVSEVRVNCHVIFNAPGAVCAADVHFWIMLRGRQQCVANAAVAGVAIHNELTDAGAVHRRRHDLVLHAGGASIVKDAGRIVPGAIVAQLSEAYYSDICISV
mgnify:CR=1 FL=1